MRIFRATSAWNLSCSFSDTLLVSLDQIITQSPEHSFQYSPLSDICLVRKMSEKGLESHSEQDDID